MKSLNSSKGETKFQFLFKNFFRGLVGFVLVLVVFILLRDSIEQYLRSYLNQVDVNGFLFYSVFTASEVLFGLIMPEFFMMIYILKGISTLDFILNLSILTLISYGAGILDYFVGRVFSKARFFLEVRNRFLKKYQSVLQKYGGYLIFVGAITPLPFSAVCMLVGSMGFPLNSFLLISTSRLIRFAVYGWMLWTFPSFFDVG